MMIKKSHLIIATACMLLGLCSFTPIGVSLRNSYQHAMHKADDDTSYESRRKVEDVARAMLASYKSDANTYEMYRESLEGREHEYALQAKMRANKTAITYNEYMLKNRYMWKGNIPDDIASALDLVR